MYFSQEQLEELEKFYSETERKAKSLLSEFHRYSFAKEKIREFAMEGVSRRIGIMNRCVDNIYRICPPDVDKKPSREKLHDIIINLHAFYINVYGALDNLAWVWVKEKNILDKKGEPLSPNKIALAKKYNDVRKSLPDSIQKYLDTEEYEKWFSHIESFRHSLAHRIPLYVPPYTLNAEEMKKRNELEELRSEALAKHQFEEFERLSDEINNIGKFIPMMTHSFSENSGQLIFHIQILSDWSTVAEICELFIEELKK